MGAPNLKDHIVTMKELIEAKYFDSEKEIYATPDSILPRVRRGGKIVRPLRFYWKDIERLFSKPSESGRAQYIGTPSDITPKPTINFKKKRKR